MVTRDGGIPLVSHAYPGNRHDVTIFPEVIDELVARYRAIAADDQELTVVFDAGQNSAGNFAHLADAGLQFVGSLPPSDYPDLLALPARRLTVIDDERFPGLTGYDTTAEALGARRRVLLTHSDTLHARQSRGFDQTTGKATRKLAELAARLERGHTRRDRDAVEADIAKITRPRWLNRVLTTTLTGDKPSQLRLTWAVDEPARRELETELFGKRILFTNRDDWPVRRRGRRLPLPVRRRSRVPPTQRPARRVLLPDAPLDRPEDPRPRLLLRPRPGRRPPDAPPSPPAGLDLSVRELLSELAGIEETVLLYHYGGGRPRARRMLTEMTLTQQRLYEIFGLDRYAPAR